MECKKCNIEVPAAFEFALAQNVCPKCGSKLMPDIAMQVYGDLKKRLREVELVMDKEVVYDRIAMFLVANYEIKSFDGKIGHNFKAASTGVSSAIENMASEKDFERAQREALAALENDEIIDDFEDMGDDIRAEESRRAQQISSGLFDGGYDVELDADEEFITGNAMDKQQAKRMAKLRQMESTGQVGMIKRSS